MPENLDVQIETKTWRNSRPDLAAWAGALAVVAFLAVVVASNFFGIMWDNDVYFIIATGRDIISNGFTDVEPLTLHDGLDYMAQQWLVCVVDASLYDAAGPLAVIAFHSLAWAVAFAAVYRCLVLLSGGRVVISRAIIAIVCLCSFAFVKTNPRAFDVLALALSILSVEAYFRAFDERAGKALGKYAISQLLLSVAMINLHAALWSVLLFAPLANLFRKGASKEARAGAVLVAFGAIVLSAFVANPYDAFMTLSYVFVSLTASSFDALGILEMQPANVGMSVAWPLFAGIAVFIACVACTERRKLQAPYVLLFCGTAILALCAIRQIPLFLIAGAFVFADLSRIMKWDAAGAVGTASIPAIACLLMLFCAVGAPLGFLVANASVERCAYKPAVDALYENGLAQGSEVYAGFNAGGYCEFRGLSPYMDARAEVFVPELNGGHDIAGEYVSLRNDEISFSELCGRYDFQAVLAETDSKVEKKEIEDAGFKIVYDEDGIVSAMRT